MGKSKKNQGPYPFFSIMCVDILVRKSKRDNPNTLKRKRRSKKKKKKKETPLNVLKTKSLVKKLTPKGIFIKRRPNSRSVGSPGSQRKEKKKKEKEKKIVEENKNKKRKRKKRNEEKPTKTFCRTKHQKSLGIIIKKNIKKTEKDPKEDKKISGLHKKKEQRDKWKLLKSKKPRQKKALQIEWNQNYPKMKRRHPHLKKKNQKRTTKGKKKKKQKP